MEVVNYIIPPNKSLTVQVFESRITKLISGEIQDINTDYCINLTCNRRKLYLIKTNKGLFLALNRVNLNNRSTYSFSFDQGDIKGLASMNMDPASLQIYLYPTSFDISKLDVTTFLFKDIYPSRDKEQCNISSVKINFKAYNDTDIKKIKDFCKKNNINLKDITKKYKSLYILLLVGIIIIFILIIVLTYEGIVNHIFQGSKSRQYPGIENFTVIMYPSSDGCFGNNISLNLNTCIQNYNNYTYVSIPDFVVKSGILQYVTFNDSFCQEEFLSVNSGGLTCSEIVQPFNSIIFVGAYNGS